MTDRVYISRHKQQLIDNKIKIKIKIRKPHIYRAREKVLVHDKKSK